MHDAPEPIQHIEIRDTKAYIAGTGLKPEIVASGHVKAGMTVAETAEYYEIPLAYVYAALTYYYDHQEAIERFFAETDAYLREHATSIEGLKAKLLARQQQAKLG